MQVHGTSNIINDFFPTGLAVTSDETAATYSELFKSLETIFKFIMADGSRAISKGKLDAMEPAEENVVNVDGKKIDGERGM